jgi:hypothetical protein
MPWMPKEMRAVPVYEAIAFPSVCTLKPSCVSASPVDFARPVALVPLYTFTVMLPAATGSAPAGGHGCGSCVAVGLGLVVKARLKSGTLRLPV